MTAYNTRVETPVLLTYAETTGYDHIGWRLIPFNDLKSGAQMYTLVEEKRRADGTVMADRRRQMGAAEYERLASAVRPVAPAGYVSDDGLASPSAGNYPGGPDVSGPPSTPSALRTSLT